MERHAVVATTLGKAYRIGARRRARTLRDVITQSAAATVSRLSRAARRGAAPQPSTRFWALRHASFAIRRGEVVGIIGRNGAGKSTLLKILARIIKPTEGEAEIRGRVASLLEVGTGFHQELTGRENIFLNGAILGMRKAEIEQTFDAIVSFAEIETFLDTPVKHYSSGMYMRLAFAVAAHLQPEILIVDEVLAVGDAAFQRKCLGRMERVAREGRTVLFVSHSMDAIRRLCTRAILVERGEIIADGNPADIVPQYLQRDCGPAGPDQWIDVSEVPRAGSGEARFVSARYTSRSTDFAGFPYPGGPLHVRLIIESDKARTVNSMAVSVSSLAGTKLLNADTVAIGERVRLAPGRNELSVTLEQVHLSPGSYSVGLWLANSRGRAFDHVDAAFTMQVVDGAAAQFGRAVHGLVPCQFHVEGPHRAEDGLQSVPRPA